MPQRTDVYWLQARAPSWRSPQRADARGYVPMPTSRSIDGRDLGACLPRRPTPDQLDVLFQVERRHVRRTLEPLVRQYCPDMMAGTCLEYRKLLELSSKMTMVGLACTRIAGFPFDARRRRVAALLGACCFLGDGFLDEFGEAASIEYLKRFELLLTKGWFEVRNDRERLFYVILGRLFAERDVLDPMLRQAIFNLFLSQKKDVELRAGSSEFQQLQRPLQLRMLRECAGNRGGNTSTVLALLLVPQLPLEYHYLVFIAGSLFMYIDDHGDCHYDRHYRRLTYMNQVKRPVPALRVMFSRGIELIHRGLPGSEGRDLLIAFLHRYYLTRLGKHRLERSRGVISWTVYA
jgi:hypothetical protein